jgi:hypothetical protein
MGMFRRNQPNDVLFLMPVRIASEKLPKGKQRMLYCDAAGELYASIISKSVCELARESAEGMEGSHKPFAILGLETGSGRFIPMAVEIRTEQVWALERILEHALKSGRLPDILKRYLKPIIKLGEANREAVISEYKKHRRQVRSEATPRVLERLPYYPEHEIEYSMPIYKAEYSYPLIVLKRLSSNKNAAKSLRSLLILDSDGDLATLKVPHRLVDNMEKGLTTRQRRNENVCVIISQQSGGMTVYYLPISRAQKKALDTITRYFEETGNRNRPISAAAKTVIIKAKDKVSSPVQ